jgi:hypothetical protein
MFSLTTRQATPQEVDAYYERRDSSVGCSERLGCALLSALIFGGVAVVVTALARFVLYLVQPQTTTGPIVWYAGAVVSVIAACVTIVLIGGKRSDRDPKQDEEHLVFVVRATADAAWLALATAPDADDVEDDEPEFFVVFRFAPDRVFILSSEDLGDQVEVTTERIGHVLDMESMGMKRQRVTLTCVLSGESIPLIQLPDETPGLSILREYAGGVRAIDEFPASLRAEFSIGLS